MKDGATVKINSRKGPQGEFLITNGCIYIDELAIPVDFLELFSEGFTIEPWSLDKQLIWNQRMESEEELEV